MELNLSKETKLSLAAKIQQLEQQTKDATATAEQAINIANYLGANVSAIESKILGTIFKGDIKRELWWVVRNWKKLIEIVEFIIETLKQVRERFDEMRKAQEEAQAKANEVNA